MPASKNSALGFEEPDIPSCLLGMSPVENHSKSGSPPAPRGSSSRRWSGHVAVHDIVMAKSTFAMIAPFLGRRVGGIHWYRSPETSDPLAQSGHQPRISRSTSHTSARIRQLSASTRDPGPRCLTTEPPVDPEPFDHQVHNGSVDHRETPEPAAMRMLGQSSSGAVPRRWSSWRSSPGPARARQPLDEVPRVRESLPQTRTSEIVLGAELRSMLVAHVLLRPTTRGSRGQSRTSSSPHGWRRCRTCRWCIQRCGGGRCTCVAHPSFGAGRSRGR